MSGGEASFYLAVLGVMVAGPAVIESANETTPGLKRAIAIGIICLLPGFVRLWIAAVAG